MLRNFAIVAVIANLAYTVALPRYGIMGGSLAGSVRGLFVHKNFFGQFSALAFIVLLPWREGRYFLTRRNVVSLGACFLALVSAAASRSSTALILVVVGTMSFALAGALNHVPKKSVRGYLLIVSLVVIGGLGATLGIALASDVAGSFGKDLTLSGRSDLWDALLGALYERPWFGHGFAMFRQPAYVAQFTQSVAWGPRSTHNTFLEMALNVGIPAAALWTMFLLLRLFGKAIEVPRDAAHRIVKAREVAIIFMVMIGSFTEAGVMLEPLAAWPLLLGALPYARLPGRRRGVAEGNAGRARFIRERAIRRPS
jgi:O-antigen ligase